MEVKVGYVEPDSYFSDEARKFFETDSEQEDEQEDQKEENKKANDAIRKFVNR